MPYSNARLSFKVDPHGFEDSHKAGHGDIFQSHLNFGTLNKLAKDGLARGIPKLKFKKDHLCSACALGKSMKSSHQPKTGKKSKDEAPDTIIKCIKNIQVRLNATARNVITDNGTEFVNQTLRKFYENIGISHQTSVARTPP
ncbi:retrovirus-related pol polyprotein from transposon TNT 1-94 [Tanacetum coccineum]